MHEGLDEVGPAWVPYVSVISPYSFFFSLLSVSLLSFSISPLVFSSRATEREGARAAMGRRPG